MSTAPRNRLRNSIRGTWGGGGRRDTHIDEIAVEQACTGRRVNLTLAERQAAIAKLTRAGHFATEIAQLLGCTPRTVTRYRRRRRETTGA